MKINLLLAVFASLLLFASCLGINADIVLNPNGSGTLTLEYRISRSLESLGRLDGNERWNTIPSGRADLERTLDRLPEMRLLSFSSGEDERNHNISVKMEFSSIQGLLDFLDPDGSRSSFTGNAQSGRLGFTLIEGREAGNPGLDRLIADISRGYSVDISMSFPGQGNLKVTDLQGSPFGAAGQITGQGRRVSGSFPLYDILSAENGINLELSW